MSMWMIFALAMTAPQPSDGPTAPPPSENVAQEPTAKLAENSDSDKKICRRSAPTGSRIPTKAICLTAKEWDELGQKTRAGLNQQFRTGATRDF